MRQPDKLRFLILLSLIFILWSGFYITGATAEEISISPQIPHPGDLASLGSENCNGLGNGSDSSLTCRLNYSNGDSLILTSRFENFGRESEAETEILSKDASGQEKESKTVRHKIRYVYAGDQKVKEAEFFDVVRYPSRGKATREIFIYEYHLETQKVKTAAWALYRRLDQSLLGSLTCHVFLTYDSDGRPLQGNISRDRNGVKVESTSLGPTAWNQWSDKVLKAPR